MEALEALEGMSAQSLSNIESMSLEELKKQKAREDERLRKLREAKVLERGDVLADGMADWDKGKLFPEGWENMSTEKRIRELWMGKRGFLFWT